MVNYASVNTDVGIARSCGDSVFHFRGQTAVLFSIAALYPTLILYVCINAHIHGYV